MGESWENDAHGAAVLSRHFAKNHTYSHTQQFPEIFCVIPTLPRSESDRRWLDQTPEGPLAHDRLQEKICADTLALNAVTDQLAAHSLRKCGIKSFEVDVIPM
jgi:hypothetical protein